MPELSLPFGPWRKIASAEWNGRPLSIYLNNESLLLLTVFDREDAPSNAVKGLLVLTKKPLLLDGSVESFSASQKRELVFIEKRSPDYHIKFLLVESTPYYIPYTQSDLVQTMQRQHQELDGLVRVLVDAAAAFDIKVRELSSLDAKSMDLLVGDPFTLFSLSGAPPSPEGLRASPKTARLKLGKDLHDAEFDVLLNSLQRVFVIGEDKLARLQTLQVLCEAALLAGIPCLIFDSTKTLAGLAVPTKDTTRLEAFGMVSLAAAFPFKAYALGKGLFIDLRQIDLDWFEKLLGLQNKELQPVLEAAYPDSSSLEDVIQHLLELKESKTLTQYLLAKTLRALRVIQKAHPAVFGKNTFAELFAPWELGIPKVYYVDTEGLAPYLKELVMLSVISGIKTPPSPVSLVCAVETPTDALSLRVKNVISEKREFAFLLHASHQADFEPVKNPSLSLDLIGEHAIASEPHKEKKRFQFRPSLTLFSATGIPH